jgi:hypothetical protein
LEEWIEDPDGVMVVDCKVNRRVEGEYLKEALSPRRKRRAR